MKMVHTTCQVFALIPKLIAITDLITHLPKGDFVKKSQLKLVTTVSRSGHHLAQKRLRKRCLRVENNEPIMISTGTCQPCLHPLRVLGTEFYEGH